MFKENISMDEYHNSEYLSRSNLKNLLISPKHFITQQNVAQTDSMALGSAAHTALLEHEKFDERYVIEPKHYINDKEEVKPWRRDRRIKAVNKFYEENEGKEIISDELANEAFSIAQDIRDDPIAGKLLQPPGSVEGSFFYTHEGLYLKARPDYLAGAGYGIDIKTTSKQTPSGFFRQAKYLAYDIQAHMVKLGVQKCLESELIDYFFIVIETGSHIVSVYSSNDVYVDSYGGETSYFEQGELRFNELIHIYKECKAKDRWPNANDDKIQPMQMI